MMTREYEVVAIVGPTACGKSSLAEAIARIADGEIVSADSMQIYRGMDIGTAKVPPDARTVAYHCIDLVDPGQPYSVALYQSVARAAIDDIRARGKLPIVCGGTGLYIRAALDDMSFPSGEQGSPLRERLKHKADDEGAAALHAQLAAIDPQSAELIHPNNIRRVIRAFELLADGTSYAQQHAGLSGLTAHYETRYIGLSMDRDRLVERIDNRIDMMLKAGLIDEIRALLEEGFEEGLTAPQAIGYKEYVPLLRAGVTPDDDEFITATDQVKLATHRYAKHQRTWFSRDDRINWIDVSGTSPDSLLSEAIAMLE